MNAEERAIELTAMPFDKLPPKALSDLEDIARRWGKGEVRNLQKHLIFMIFRRYAHQVEGFPL